MDRGLLEDTKSILKSLIISCPHGMTIDQLNKDYRNMEGRWIPYSALGFTKLEIFLKSITDTLIVSGSGYDAKVQAITSEKTAHIDNMVAKQKNSSRSKRPQMPRRSTTVNNYRPPIAQPLIQQPAINHTPAQHPNHQHNRQQQQHHQIHHQQQYYNGSWNQNDYINLLNQQLSSYRNFQLHLQRNSAQFINNFHRQYQNVAHIPAHILNPLQQHQNMPHNNIPILNRLQHDTHNNTIQKQSQQLKQLPEKNSLSNANIVNGYRSSSPKLNNNDYSSSTSPSLHNNVVNGELSSSEESRNKLLHNSIRSLEENTSNSHDKTDEFQETTIKSVLSEHSSKSLNSGRDRADLIEAVTNKKIDAYDNLLNVADEHLEEITDRFHALTLNSQSDTKANSFSILEAIPELQQNDIIFQLDYPINTVKFGEYIPESEIPEDIADASWFGIFITEIHNPYKFWFHLFKENHELDTLMQEIENRYTGLGTNELQLHVSSAKPGQICCALFMGMWHRAEILELPDHGKVKVCFVDYGTVSLIELRHIKYLLVDFSSLRSQALRGTLGHIKPITHRWSRDATYAFLDMVSDLLLYAKAIDINYKDRVIQMILTDTNKEIDFQINDALVRKGHARLCTTVATTQSTSSESQITTTPRKHFQETYPTFEMLEKGEYPSFTELGILLSKGINFEALQDQNIIPDVDGGHSIEEITKKLTTPNVSRTEVIDIIDDSDDSEKYDDEVDEDEEKEELILESLLENNVNHNTSILSNPEKLNPFLTTPLPSPPQPSRFNPYNNSNKIISPVIERKAQEKHLSVEENLNENAFVTNSKFNSLNPFIAERSYEQVQPKLIEQVQTVRPAIEIETQIIQQQQMLPPTQPFYINSQQQVYYQAPTQPLPIFQNLNFENSQHLNQFNNFNGIPNGNMTYDQLIQNHSMKPKRPPPGFENIVPRSRNILFQ